MQPTLGTRASLPSSLIDNLRSVMDDVVGIIDTPAHVIVAVGPSGDAWNALCTDQVAAALNDVELNSGGPALDALWSGCLVRIGSTLSQAQWPEYVQTCKHHGVGSVVALPISTDSGRVGVVTIASDDYYAFGPEATRVGLAAARRAANIIDA